MGATGQKPTKQPKTQKSQSQKLNGKPSKSSKKQQNKITITIIIIGVSLLSSLYSVVLAFLGNSSANVIAQNPQLLAGF